MGEIPAAIPTFLKDRIISHLIPNQLLFWHQMISFDIERTAKYA